MPTLVWTDELLLGVPAMDTTHREFVDLLATVEAAPDDTLIPAWSALVDHTQIHFDNEDQYMHTTGFAATNCHTTQHAMVLGVMRKGLTMGQAGDMAPIRQMARELATWFVHHADTMDAALAMHLQRVGFDPATGTIAHAQAVPAEAIHGCGGATCSEPDTAADATSTSATSTSVSAA
ncbi:hemerythrin domain-containing protein [Ottowia sp.]|uniref:hemerythrin domain-containing protein n=1 Tax=Ottowia sp. TaxID=1898956 RepID=UPI003A895123